MDWIRAVVVLQVLIQPCLSALFTVEAEQVQYQSEFGGDVVLGCRFGLQPDLSVSASNLKVTWHWISSSSPSPREVYRLDNWVEQLVHQDPVYRGRATLLKEELKNNWAKLKISDLRISDSGTYQCLVQIGQEADYKEVLLSVTAPYKTVTKRLQKVDGGDEALLTCQADGYPEPSVQWRDGHGRPVNASTAVAPTPQQLFAVTSEIRVRFPDDNNYTCIFGGGYSATFLLADELHSTPPALNAALFVALGFVATLTLLLAAFLYRRRKGQGFNRGNDEEKRIFNEGVVEETLRALWSVRSANLSEEEKLHIHTFVTEALPRRLQNDRGQPAGLQALVPEPGQTLFLEGPPGSGKTTVAQFLAFSRAAGSSNAPSGAIDLSGVHLVVHLDCSKVKGHLLQEVTRLLSAAEKVPMEEELRAALAGSSEVLLLLDGYREGNQVFDESLKRFLRDRSGCRVLITACPGQCRALKDTCTSAGVLRLHSTS
ncbi:B7-H1/DC protein precursor [Takifugu rubripes]|uniref:B7-H1/DC n=1 Tax=Takifugu rubripes TaxID=31033 RepID=B9ZZN5_TAKRU|nr:B7-H1/DC protein precursor [Takifugu rubripes]BAH30159.1 B7-H1/DC [Takifugu rubripes]|eukprot:NP_001177293.1 B7-H1/DC protein precursor [Takifugu rubripes]